MPNNTAANAPRAASFMYIIWFLNLIPTDINPKQTKPQSIHSITRLPGAFVVATTPGGRDLKCMNGTKVVSAAAV